MQIPISRDQRQQLGIEMHHYILCVGGLRAVSDDVREFFLDILDSNSPVEVGVDSPLLEALQGFLDEVQENLSLPSLRLPKFSLLARMLAEVEVQILINSQPGKG
jgi:hypothetical protein